MEYFTWAKLKESNKSKGELFEGLTKTFDFALPQGWLDSFVKEHDLDYEMVRFSTVWVYPESAPFSVCKEVNDILVRGK